MSATQLFFAKWFPITVRGDTHAEAMHWFERSAVARLHPYVVECWGDYRALYGAYIGDTGVRRTIGYGYGALVVRIVEHGVGEITKAWFEFEDYLQAGKTKSPFFVESKDGALSWRGPEPADMTELLTPLEHYIHLWISTGLE